MLNRDTQGTSNRSQESTVAASQASPGSRGQQSGESGNGSQETAAKQLPSISIPKGGGAIRGMGEKFAANPVTGTGSMSVPIAANPGRSGFGPQLALSYDSGAGNGPFGFGWNLSLPSITRKTDKGLPQYRDAEESDVFILSGAEDLVPEFEKDADGNLIVRDGKYVVYDKPRTLDGIMYRVRRYRPRIEGLFARIERWTGPTEGDVHWRSISKDNILTIYGKNANSRIFDQENPEHIFSWLICETRDDKGNAVIYNYKPEDGTGVDLSQVHERNRGDLDDMRRTANRYLKRIFYGNRVSLLDDAGNRPRFLTAEQIRDARWMFEVVFDYGEHYAENDQGQPTLVTIPDTDHPWATRQDPFSSYRAGFEVRTYRLCRRVLMFHHFPELGTPDCLVRATEFTYTQSLIASFITKVTQSGYVYQSGTYLKKSLPPVEFEYSQAVINEEIHAVDSESLENLPYGLDGARYQWMDLDGEGLSGILTEQGDGWFYKRNLSPINIQRENGREMTTAKFAPVELVAEKPSLAALNSGGQQFLDLAGDGQLDLVDLQGPTPGFYERTHDERWESFAPFNSLPVLEWGNPNLKFVDLTGDGHADIFISEDEAFCWHPSLAEAGFGSAETVRQALDEEKGPRLVFADGTQSIYLADISGDGLTDLVRIRNGEVCYWPNLGYGRFGMKVTMDNAPWFDAPDLFDQRRIRLADIDGSGVTDIIYLGSDGVQIYFNQSGNSWKEVQTLTQFPRIDDLSAVMAVDLLGNGTACLVWSSTLLGDARQPMRYIDLMGGQKPHLLIRTINNLGAETEVEYAPSTKFYVRDRRDGKPWITKIPFPVHVVERVITKDHISRNRFVTRYIYHHGYFDGIEREFRGFGMVEQFDTEEFDVLSDSDDFPDATNLDEASHVPPVHTKTWFHIGVYLDREHISRQFEGEYYREPGLSDPDFRALLLPDTILPPGLTLEDELEACRALKGMMLRQEVYADDAPPGSSEAMMQRARRPYTVVEQNFTIRTLQPHAGNRHAVFFTHPREAITYHYERRLVPILNGQIVDEDTAASNPDTEWLPDPRIQHALTLEVDDFGNVLKAAAVGYGRRLPDTSLSDADQDKQTKILISYSENRVTNSIDDVIVAPDDYRTPLPCETRTFELTGYTPTGETGRFQSADFVQIAGSGLTHVFDTEIDYEDLPTSGKQRRLIEHVRILYRKNDLTDLLPLGAVESLALPGESYKLAFTASLLAIYQRPHEGQPPENLLPDPPHGLLRDEAKYIDFDGDGHWWIPSGRVFFSPNDEAPNDELAFAQDHFFLPHRVLDPFGETAVVQYDDYKLLATHAIDPLGNTIIAENDYRVLQPELVTDPNGNRAQVAFDTLGMVVGTAVMGKENVLPAKGDSLALFNADLDEATILARIRNPLVNPHDILQSATMRLVYDLFAYHRTRNETQPQSAVVYTLARETHVADLAPGEQTKVQHSFSYSDGFGREIQKKIQAEPEKINGVVGPPRWVGSGWTIFNNKGKPVRQYEPFFSPTHEFEFAKMVGVSSVLFYDPVERVIATLHPNDTYEKVIFDPWRQESWDVNDTVLLDPRTDTDVRGFTEKYFEAVDPFGSWQTWYAQRDGGEKGPQEQDAATKAAAHADTSTVAHFDTLGRPFMTIADNGVAGTYETRVELDIEGNQRSVTDARNLQVMAYDYDMLGTRIHQNSMDAGERWMLSNVAGKPIRGWDSRDHTITTKYDALQRPTELWVQHGSEILKLAERTVYGETFGDALNMRGKVYQMYDAAGVGTNNAYDFKGNLLSSTRQLLENYTDQVNWNEAQDFEDETFTSSTTYDALNRPVTLTTPDNSVIHPIFNEANLLNVVNVNLRGVNEETAFVTNIDYDAKGQRKLIAYGNGVQTDYEYDPLTFRLTNLKTIRGTNTKLQDLFYTYDPVGNITHIRDDAQQIIYFNNTVVNPSNDYTYDAIYRLISATGREHIGQQENNQPHHRPELKPEYDFNDITRRNLAHPHDGQKMQTYTQLYEYDEVGNILKLIHQATSGSFTRRYQYEANNNQLTSTSLPGDSTTGTLPRRYTYDAHGNMINMPHLREMLWDFKDQLREVDLNGGGRAYYVYDASGQRVRKVHEHNGGLVEERIYLGGFEIYRKNGVNPLVRETLHIMDDKQRIALVDTRTEGEEDEVPEQLIRYQFGNHLGSACLELDDDGAVISYEEYHPYGTTSYQAGRTVAEVSLKRYRYTGMERDEETGLNYHTARYYAPWLGRWVKADPAGLVDSSNRYLYVSNNPIASLDVFGLFGISSQYFHRADTHAPGLVPPEGPLPGDPAPQMVRFETNSGRYAWFPIQLPSGEQLIIRLDVSARVPGHPDIDSDLSGMISFSVWSPQGQSVNGTLAFYQFFWSRDIARDRSGQERILQGTVLISGGQMEMTRTTQYDRPHWHIDVPDTVPDQPRRPDARQLTVPGTSSRTAFDNPRNISIEDFFEQNPDFESITEESHFETYLYRSQQWYRIRWINVNTYTRTGQGVQEVERWRSVEGVERVEDIPEHLQEVRRLWRQQMYQQLNPGAGNP